MPDSSPPPPSTTKESLPGGPKPKEDPPDISELNYMTEQHKKTRELPNLSDCHGCSRRINYSNPNERLQPLDSFWRIVLLCKKCSKQVNDGQLCPYCFKDTSLSVSDCYSCANCYRLVHKDCILHFGNSAPWSYCSDKTGSSFTVCVDCWIPDKLRRSIRGKGRRGQSDAMLFNPSIRRAKCSGKVSGGGRSSANAAKEAKRALEQKLVVAAKAKEVALRKALAARNAVELASNALNLVASKCPDGGKERENEKEGLVGSSSNDSDSERVEDDAELAFQLHLAMNSSRRLLKKFCPLKDRCLELLKLSDSSANNGKEGNDCCTLTGPGELKPDIITYRHRKRKQLQESATEASKTSNCTDSYLIKPELLIYKRNSKKRKECEQPSVVEANGSSVYVDTCGVKLESVTHELNNVERKENQQSDLDVNESSKLIELSVLKPEMVTCEQNDGNRKEQQSDVEAIESCTLTDSTMPTSKECGQSSECGHFVYADGSVATHAHAEDSSLVRESQSSLQDASKDELCGNAGKLSTPEGCNDMMKECGQSSECGHLVYEHGSVATHAHDEDSSLVRESQSSLQDASKDELCGNAGRLSTPEGCNDMMKESGQSSESGHLVYADGSVATHAHAEDSSLVRESQSSLQDASKDELCGNDGRLSTPEGCSVDVGGDLSTQDNSGDTKSDRYSIKYSRRRTASGSI